MAIKMASDGRCACSCADECPLGRTGATLRCTREELDRAGVSMEMAQSDPLARETDPITPSYYERNGIKAIEVVEAWELGHHLATAVVYILRAGKKPGDDYLQDLKKAKWYLDRAIALFEKKEK